jgi:hypothetical protein
MIEIYLEAAREPTTLAGHWSIEIDDFVSQMIIYFDFECVTRAEKASIHAGAGL